MDSRLPQTVCVTNYKIVSKCDCVTGLDDTTLLVSSTIQMATCHLNIMREIVAWLPGAMVARLASIA